MSTTIPPPGRKVLTFFSIPSEPGNERLVMQRVVQATEHLQIVPAILERLKTAVAEAAMNAIEHGNANQPELTVDVEVAVSGRRLSVRVTDQGGGEEIPQAVTPDLDAKLAGLQSPRGWGLFLIRNMVDELHVNSDEHSHTVELILNLNGVRDGHDRT